MFSGQSPFAWAAVIGKPGVLLFQRPGSMEWEVILGPRRRAWENGGGCRADKKQTLLRQEHVERHTHTGPSITTVISKNSWNYENRQMYSVAQIFTVCATTFSVAWKKHACDSKICNGAINYPQHKTALCFLHLWPTISWCFGGIFLTDKKALCSIVPCPSTFAQTPICHSQMSSPICSTLVWPQCWTMNSQSEAGSWNESLFLCIQNAPFVYLKKKKKIF